MPFIVHKNKIVYEEEGVMLAEVDFPPIDEETVDICHTFVDSSLRGKGIAGQLMERAVASLRETGRKAYPTCSYAVYWFDEHPEHDDILSDNAG
ncbi:MAG TPA: N-acetyltransferase [Papillibacter sp.]|jgi:predicted GNAT family acetyltransferase|nr:N-acetyltransferase [Papillibacter sp.]